MPDLVQVVVVAGSLAGSLAVGFAMGFVTGWRAVSMCVGCHNYSFVVACVMLLQLSQSTVMSTATNKEKQDNPPT